MCQDGGVKTNQDRTERTNNNAILLALFCAVMVMVSGCQAVRYESATGERFSRWSVGNKTSIAHLEVESGTNGVRRLNLRGYQSDSAAAMGAVTEAAVRAAVGAAKP